MSSDTKFFMPQAYTVDVVDTWEPLLALRESLAWLSYWLEDYMLMYND